MPTLAELKISLAKYERALEERDVMLALLSSPEIEPKLVEVGVRVSGVWKNLDVEVGGATLRRCLQDALVKANAEISHLAGLLNIR